MHNYILFCLFITCFFFLSQSVEFKDRAYFQKKTSEELNEFLDERGVPCVACTRGQLISLSFESQHLPLIKYKPKEEIPSRPMDFKPINPNDPNFDTFVERMTDKDSVRRHASVIEQLKQQGFDVSAVEKPKDDMNNIFQKARDLREKTEAARLERERKGREERRKRREERKRRAEERAKERQNSKEMDKNVSKENKSEL